MSNALSSTDQALAKVIRNTDLRTIPDVIALMEVVHRTLSENDGLWWFNVLYCMVTKEIYEDCRRQKWLAPEWLTHLDVEFAKLYFTAIVQWIEDTTTCPRAWASLFKRRFIKSVSPVQFGLAGMNAHINRDLPVAVVRACQKTHCIAKRGTPEEADFQRVNKILDEVEIHAMQKMATGLIRAVSDRVQPIDRKFAMAVVSWARDLAWTHAEVYAGYLEEGDEKKAAQFIDRLDRHTEKVGRALLVPTEWKSRHQKVAQ